MDLRRKLALMLVKKRPYYCEVEYLYTGDDINCMSSSPFTSTSYRLIDTNETIDLTSVVEIKFAFDKNIYFSGCGLRNNSSNMTQSVYFPACYSTQDKFGWTIGLNEEQRQKFTLDTNDHTIRVDLPNSNVVWDNVNYPIENLTYTPSERTFPLFAFSDVRATQDNGYRFPMQGKIYYAKFWKNGVLVKHLVPVLDWDMTPCMYDKISGQLFYNQGTGDFIAGREIHPVEYLESTGTQYIDTGITINTSTDEVVSDFQLISTTLYQWMMGEHDNGARFGIGVGDGTNKRNIAYGATTYKVQDVQVYNEKHNFKANSNGVFFDDVQIHGYENFASTSTVYLFTLNLSGANGAAGKIWNYKHKRNGNLVRDYIPAIDSNGTAFMFDRVTHTIYDNAGTGAFGYSAREVEYLEGTGTQYIDTGIDYFADFEIGIQLRTNVSNKALGNGGYYCMQRQSSTSPSWQFTSGQGNYYNSSTRITEHHVMKWKENKVYADDVLLTEFTKDSNTPNRMYLYTTGTNNKYPNVIYFCKLWNPADGTLVRDFIPVYKDGVLGMLDKANNVFYPNAGTGDGFITGKIVEPEYE